MEVSEVHGGPESQGRSLTGSSPSPPAALAGGAGADAATEANFFLVSRAGIEAARDGDFESTWRDSHLNKCVC